MTIRKRWLISILGVTLILASIAYVNRIEIALALVGFSMERRVAVGPNRDVTWQSGVDDEGRAPGLAG